MHSFIKTGALFATAILVQYSVSARPFDADSTGLPGDNLSLQAALSAFSTSTSIEDFEKKLNTAGNDINNLDLNGDGDIDYIRVIDKTEGDAHAFVLQAVVSASESQDIAVIELEKDGAESASVQIVGDEDIYGEETIVEPGDDSNAGVFYNGEEMLSGPSAVETPVVVVNVWAWPSVRFVYGPVYRPWVSPWRWAAYPGWYRPWHPVAFHVFHPRRVHYHTRFVVVPTHRMVAARKVYRPARVTSVTVTRRYSAPVGHYRATTTRKTTVVKGPRGNTRAVRTTRHTRVRRH